jgi:hypothetical protein
MWVLESDWACCGILCSDDKLILRISQQSKGGMENRPSFDRSLLLPIGVGMFALIGICGILVSGRLNAQPATVEEIPTATSFQYAYIGTEPAILTVTLETPLETPEEAVAPPEIPAEPEFPTPAPPSTQVSQFTNTSPAIITLPPLNPTNTPPRTPSSAAPPPFAAGTYDDTDSRFVYSGVWDKQTSVPGVYQNTLHVSGTLQNSITFLFIGNELRVFFQEGPSLGTIRLALDNNSYVMSEAGTSTQRFEWVVSAASSGTHTVTITHDSGGSVNFDGIIVPVVAPTPTNTSTN